MIIYYIKYYIIVLQLPKVFSTIRRWYFMSQNTTKFARCCYFELTTCFGPYSGPSSGHKSIYLRKLYSVSHKIYQSKIQRDIFHHHHHVPEGLGMLSCSLILKMKLVPPSLPRSSYDSSSFWFIL